MRNHMAAGWFYSPKQVGRYLLSRPASLKPPRAKLRNPIHILAELDKHQWLMFSAGFLAWCWDSFDFFTVTLTLTEVAADFGVSNADVSWGITVTLMLRSVGALIFGVMSDRYGRKWPMIICLMLFIIVELASGFAQNLTQFLALRSLFGIAMGGLFGPAAATALEDLPYDARGLLSGLFEQAYAMGYLLAAIFYRALVPTTAHGWRSLFYFGAVPPVFIIMFRFYLPETNAFLIMKAQRETAIAAREEHRHMTTQGLRAWARETLDAVRSNWVLFIYMILLMTGFNTVGHGSLDFYPTFLKNQVGLHATEVTVISVVSQLGALTGGTTLGYLSTFCGRRLTMLTGCVLGAAITPAYVLPHTIKLAASAFFMQFFAGGIWGPVPIYLSELSPDSIRATAVGLTYQLGNLASAASATIQAIIGERFPLEPKNGVKRFDYGKVIGIFMGIVWVIDLVLLFLGPEMSEQERQEYAASANESERLRKSGVSLADIGAEKAKAVVLQEKSRPGEEERESEKAVDTQHAESEREVV
ncbi:hypothetical protein KVR01_007394 [Diaporthe batatas]|uniref:uncharacterized protein n=1 Tax=Diaporthe batatas TaxID=748121 RepID=UPI001D045B03|nr:uncharacterized protein KVR01_007394 [Diaporthe batatas]KAG8162916.1 hypothetical protein KVR01_007394 [Diaporthe batatas]